MEVTFGRRSVRTVAAVALGLLLVAAAHAAGGRAARRVVAPARVVVTAGKPTEFSFRLSAREVPVGRVEFEVTNRGKIPHSFEICTSARGGNANACSGRKTPVLAPGRSATLTLRLAKGRYEYLCTVAGHAAGGMKGILGVGVAPGAAPTAAVVPAPLPTTTVAVTPAPPPAQTAVVGDPTAGAALFQQAGCASCHTLKAANATGTVGPNLDQVAPDETTVVTNVTFGNAMGMPAFSPQFSAAQIQDIAAYVYTSTHH
jgi:mono/diheme cytochrome c family protein